MFHYRHALWAVVVLACMALLLAPAAWNGFALLQYDTGGYLAPWYEGALHISRSLPYGALLIAGQWPDFWPVLFVQSALTVWVLALVLRAHDMGNRPLLLFGIVAALSLVTTLPWLTAILLTDIFAGFSVLALYLLLMRDKALRRGERGALFLLVATSAATHSATLIMLVLLTAAAGAISLFDSRRIALTRVGRAAMALLLGAFIVLATDFMATGSFTWTPGGPALSFGRMLEDGIVRHYLDDHCPDPSIKLCPYRNQLPSDADGFFWGGGVFDELGRFAALNDEMRHIAFAAFIDYPGLQLKSIISETAKQTVLVETGAGVVNWIWNTYGTIKSFTPAALPAMEAARQQRTGISFDAINAVQMPLALLCMALLPFVAAFTLRRKEFTDIGELNISAALTILANAAVFGIFATAHNRYGARVVWIATLAILLTLVRIVMRWRPDLFKRYVDR
jgi:hypothetical protein